MEADATCGTASPKHCLPPPCLSQLLHSSRPLSALFLPRKHHNLSKQRVLKEESREGRGRLNVSSGTHSSGLSQPRRSQRWCSRWRSAVLRDHQDPQVPYCVAAFQSTSSLHTLVLVSPSGQDFAIPITEADVSFTTVLQIVKAPLASSLTSSMSSSCVS